MPPQSQFWESPSHPIAVRLSLDVVQRLRLAAVEAWKSVPRRGLEIGGLLLGRLEKRDGGATISIQNFTAVQSEHRSGPFYRLSEADRERFADVFRAHPEAIGIYRSQTRSEELSLEEDDVNLFQQYFAGRNGVFLLIQPAAGRAGLFTEQEGALALAHDVPFHPADLQPASEAVPQTSMTEQLPPPADPGCGAPGRNGSEHHRQATSAVGTRRWMLPAASAVLGMVAAATVFHFRPQPQRPQVVAAARPSLNLEREGRGLRLRWDQGSEAVRQASHGTLYITDGPHQSRMELSRGELTAGSLAYWPDSGDVMFRLELSGPGRTWVDSIRYVNAPAVQPAAGTAQADPVPREPAAPPEPKRPTPQAAAPKTSKHSYAPVPHPAQESASRSEDAEAHGSPPTPATQVAPALESSLSVPKPASRAPVNPSRNLEPPAPAVSVSAEPVTASRLGRLVRRIPFVRRFKKEPQVFEPPHATHEVRPALSIRERAELVAPVPVDVKVYVAESGKVEYAELLSGGRFRDLAAEAVYAARRWAFSPARMGEEPVPGEVILHFRFEPAGK